MNIIPQVLLRSLPKCVCHANSWNCAMFVVQSQKVQLWHDWKISKRPCQTFLLCQLFKTSTKWWQCWVSYFLLFVTINSWREYDKYNILRNFLLALTFLKMLRTKIDKKANLKAKSAKWLSSIYIFSTWNCSCDNVVIFWFNWRKNLSTLLESTCNDLQFFPVNRSKGAAIVVSNSTGTSTNSSAQVSKAGQTFTSIMTSIKMFSDRILRFELKSLLKFLSKWKPQ